MKELMKYLVLYVVLSISFLACRHDIHTTQAKIIERRDLGNNKIRLSYLFKAGHTTIAGVKIIDGSIIVPLDSCVVEYKVSNPLENDLKLP